MIEKESLERGIEMIRRTALITAVLIAGGLLALFLWPRNSPQSAEALPQAAQARYYDMTVTTSDGREFQLPDRIVTCSLELTISAVEGLYICPAPHNIESLLAPPQVSAGNFAKKASVMVEIDGAVLASGLPANSWQTIQVLYGASLQSPNVVLGEEYTNGETGHIENTVWPDFSRGVFSSYFFYRAKANGSGYMGTEYLVRGTQ